MFGGISRQKHLKFDIILVLMMIRKLVMSNYGKMNFILMVTTVLFQYKIFFICTCKMIKFLIVKMPSNQLIANSIFVKKIVIKTFKICINKNSYSKFVLLKLSCYKICIKIFNMLPK